MIFISTLFSNYNKEFGDFMGREELVKQLTYRDALTGLYNRTYFEEILISLPAEEWMMGMIGIIVCDIDGMQMVNENEGYEMGDVWLITTANLISGLFRDKKDIVARIAGDEFAIVLTGTTKQAIEKVCQKIYQAAEMNSHVNPQMKLSLSIGYAIEEITTCNLQELFREAESNMYRIKLQHGSSTRSALVKTLMKALEFRDITTEEHASRMQKLVISFAQFIGFPGPDRADLCLLAKFHDIGKIGVPDRVLLKPGPLTAEERKVMQSHCEIGYELTLSSPPLAPIADWILKHHEWWNGKGYPLNLKGEEIPLECRIVAIVDAFDAIISNRPYRKALPFTYAVSELTKGAGTQFDPVLVPKFIQLVTSSKILDSGIGNNPCK